MIFTIFEYEFDDTLTSQIKICMSMSIDCVLKKFSATEIEMYFTNDHCSYSRPSLSRLDQTKGGTLKIQEHCLGVSGSESASFRLNAASKCTWGFIQSSSTLWTIVITIYGHALWSFGVPLSWDKPHVTCVCSGRHTIVSNQFDTDSAEKELLARQRTANMEITVDGSEIRLTSWYGEYPIFYRVL